VAADVDEDVAPAALLLAALEAVDLLALLLLEPQAAMAAALMATAAALSNQR
jgi:hypothetical protein